MSLTTFLVTLAGVAGFILGFIMAGRSVRRIFERDHSFQIAEEGFLMANIRADHPDHWYTIVPPKLVDSENNPVDMANMPAGTYLHCDIQTTAESVVSFQRFPAAEPGGNNERLLVHFGAPGLASLEVRWYFSDGMTEPRFLTGKAYAFTISPGLPYGAAPDDSGDLVPDEGLEDVGGEPAAGAEIHVEMTGDGSGAAPTDPDGPEGS